MASFDMDSWWPSITSRENAQTAMEYGGVGAGFNALLAAGAGALAIYLAQSGSSLLGHSGSSYLGQFGPNYAAAAFSEAALFAIMAWRIYRHSLPWSVAGLVLYSAGEAYAIAKHPEFSFWLVLSVFMWPYYVNAVRGGLYLRRTRPLPIAYPPTEAGQMIEAQTEQTRPAEVQHSFTAVSSTEEYEEFLNCMRRGERKFQRAGYTVQEEFAAWLKDHRKKLASARAAEEKASSTRTA